MAVQIKILQSGEIIRVEDPQPYLLTGNAVVVTEDGRELDAFALYGRLPDSEQRAFEAFKKAKEAKNNNE